MATPILFARTWTTNATKAVEAFAASAAACGSYHGMNLDKIVGGLIDADDPVSNEEEFESMLDAAYEMALDDAEGSFPDPMEIKKGEDGWYTAGWGRTSVALRFIGEHSAEVEVSASWEWWCKNTITEDEFLHHVRYLAVQEVLGEPTDKPEEEFLVVGRSIPEKHAHRRTWRASDRRS